MTITPPSSRLALQRALLSLVLPTLLGVQQARAQSDAGLPAGSGPILHSKPANSNALGAGHRILTATNKDWCASFDAAGARFETPLPVQPDQTVGATLRLIDHGRTGRVQTASPIAPEQRSDANLQFRRANILERYQVNANGFEQSFVLNQRPEGHGDYVIGIAVQGDGIELPRRQAAHQALVFRHDGVPTVRYGEAYAFERGGAPIEIATRCDGDRRIELIVPGAFLDKATYPVTIDPAVGPVFAPAGLGTWTYAPDVAQNPVTGNYAFVWERRGISQRDGWTGTRIFGRLYDRDGNPLTGVTWLLGGGGPEDRSCRNPTICSSNLYGPGFLVACETLWTIRRTGILIGAFSATDLTSQAATAQTQGYSQTAWDPHHYQPRLCDGDGMALLVHHYLDINSAGSDVTAIMARAVGRQDGPTPALRLFTPKSLEQATSPDWVGSPSVSRSMVHETAADGTVWGKTRVVWDRFYSTPGTGDTDLRTAIVRATPGRQPIRSLIAGVPGGSDIGRNEGNADIGMMAGSWTDPDPRFLIAWEEEGDVKAIVHSFGFPTTAEITIAAASNLERHPAIGAGACEFSVGYLDTGYPQPESVNVRAVRVLPDGTVPTPPRAVDVLNGPEQDGLRATSLHPMTPNGYRVNSVRFAWMGHTPTPTDRTIRSRRFDPVATSWNPFGSACPGPNGELPTIGRSGEPIPGNTLFEITLNNAPPNSSATLIVGDEFVTTPLPGAPGCMLYMGTPVLSILTTTTNSAGFASLNKPIPCGVPAGLALAYQWIVMTPGHNAGGYITSNDLDISWRH